MWAGCLLEECVNMCDVPSLYGVFCRKSWFKPQELAVFSGFSGKPLGSVWRLHRGIRCGYESSCIFSHNQERWEYHRKTWHPAFFFWTNFLRFFSQGLVLIDGQIGDLQCYMFRSKTERPLLYPVAHDYFAISRNTVVLEWPSKFSWWIS